MQYDIGTIGNDGESEKIYFMIYLEQVWNTASDVKSGRLGRGQNKITPRNVPSARKNTKNYHEKKKNDNTQDVRKYYPCQKKGVAMKTSSEKLFDDQVGER